MIYVLGYIRYSLMEILMCYEYKVVAWKETRDWVIELIKSCDGDEIKVAALALLAVEEKLEYWEKVCQPDFFDDTEDFS